jgi:hypothetical protein
MLVTVITVVISFFGQKYFSFRKWAVKIENNLNNFRANQLPGATRSIADIWLKHRVSAWSHLQGNWYRRQQRQQFRFANIARGKWVLKSTTQTTCFNNISRTNAVRDKE